MDSLNVDMLLDSEIREMENSILEKQSTDKKEVRIEESKDEIPEAPPKPAKAKSPTKPQLIENYQKLAQESGREIESEARLQRMTKSELTKKIAELMNQEIGGESPPAEAEKIAGDIQLMKQESMQQFNPEKLNLVAESIFNMNLAFCSIIETGTNHPIIKDKTFGVAALEGWTSKVYSNKTRLVEIFRLMYADYKETFDKYLSPVVQWSIVMIQTGTETAITNFKKKREESKDK